MRMSRIVKKIGYMLITIFLVALCVFFAFSLIPGDPATSMLGTNATPEKLAALREQLGLNQPLLVRFFKWAGGFVHGDMGISYSYSIPVKDLILDKLPITITLTLMSFIFMLIIAIPLGIYTATHAGGKMDRTIYCINQLMMAIPPFFAGIIITYLFGRVFRLFTPGGFVSYSKNFGKFIHYLIFPAIAIALPKAAMAVKLLRSSLIEEIGQDYVRTAYSRGNRTKQVLYRHVLQNALIPVVTFLGMTLADMVAGSIIIEQVFSIPGLGRILLTSIFNRDYPVVEALIVCIAILVIVINFLVDLLYRRIDPRIREE